MDRMRPFLQALIMLLLHGACTHEHAYDKSLTEIAGHIDHPYAARIYLYGYPDSLHMFLNEYAVIDSSAINGQGNYAMHLKLTQPGICFLKMGDSLPVPNLFVNPGNHIQLDFKGARGVPVFNTRNPEGKYNDYLQKLVDRFYNDPEVKRAYYITSNYLDIFTFSSYINERKRQQLVFFGNYFKGANVSPEFTHFALCQIMYQYGIDKLMWRWKKRMKNEPVENDPGYYRFMTPEYVYNARAMHSPSYMRFLYLYLKDMYERGVESSAVSHSLSATPVAVQKYKLALQHMHGIQRDIVLYNLMKEDGLCDEDQCASGKVSLDSLQHIFKRKYSLD